MKSEVSDYKQMWESYVTVLEVKNSRNNRIMFMKKFGTDEETAMRYLEDFTAVQNKIQDPGQRDMFSSSYFSGEKGLMDLDRIIKSHQGDVGRSRKVDKMIEWATNHKNKISDNERGVAVRIDNHDDSRRFAQLTQWCTTTACSKNWDRYEDENVSFIYIINKDKSYVSPKSNTSDGSTHSDFFALAVYPMSWEDLHAKRPEVAYIPNSWDDDPELSPMYDTAKYMNLDISDLVESIETIWDEYQLDDNDEEGEYREERIGDVQDEFAARFIKAWDAATGGAPAIEAYNENDDSLDPIGLIEHFEVSGIIGDGGYKAPAPLEGDDRLNAMISDETSLQHAFKIYEKYWVPAHKDDQERMDPRYNPENQNSPQRKLKPRWPALEA